MDHTKSGDDVETQVTEAVESVRVLCRYARTIRALPVALADGVPPGLLTDLVFAGIVTTTWDRGVTTYRLAGGG